MENYLKSIISSDKYIYNKAKKYIDFLAKPLGSLGELEEISARLCSIYRSLDIDIDKKAIIVLASDNGIVEEGIACTPQDITAIQTVNILEGKTGVAVIAKQFNVDIFVCDVGIKCDINHPNIINKKIRKCTNNFTKKEAMTREEAIRTINVGIELVNDAKRNGYKILGTGEMGIGNTTTSSAVLASILDLKEDEIQNVVGIGAGLTEDAYNKKVEVIKNGVKKHSPNKNDVIDIIQKLGGFDICAMIGVYIGCAYNRIPAVVDGFIAIVAALCAIKLNSDIKDYIFLSHKSMEKGYILAQKEIGLPAYLDLKMRLGEGSGCPLMFSIIDASLAMFKNMATFDEAKIDTEYLKNLK